MIVLDVDIDPRLEDPHDVAAELLDDTDSDGNRIDWPAVRSYAECPATFVSAEWGAS